jgi:hypothetical protein
MADAPRRPPGRPPADEPRSIVSTWLPTRDHDRLIRLAQLQKKSLSALARDILEQRLRDPRQ